MCQCDGHPSSTPPTPGQAHGKRQEICVCDSFQWPLLLLGVGWLNSQYSSGGLYSRLLQTLLATRVWALSEYWQATYLLLPCVGSMIAGHVVRFDLLCYRGKLVMGPGSASTTTSSSTRLVGLFQEPVAWVVVCVCVSGEWGLILPCWCVIRMWLDQFPSVSDVVMSCFSLMWTAV